MKWFIGTFWLTAFVFAPHSLGQNFVDFQSQVLPILKSRCFECHDGGDVKGNLRLDSKAGMDERGYSGLPIIAPTANESELILRIRSADDEYRMPKSAPALPDSEIALLTQWVTQGAPYSAAKPAKPVAKSNSLVGWLADGYLRGQELLLEKPYRYAGVVMLPFMLYLVFVLAAVGARHQSLKRDSANEFRFPWARWKPFAITTIVFGIAAILAFQHGMVEESQAKVSELQNEIRSTTGGRSNQDNHLAPFAPKPMHPKRLGGVYYRGNDERSKGLFNGGFYRTAELTVELVDGDQQPLNYGQSVSSKDLAIRLEVKRSPGTEAGMFSERTIENTFVSSSFSGTESASDRMMLKPVAQGDSWEVIFPITADQTTGRNLSGVLYVYYGPLDHNRIHYAIHYDLQTDDAGMLLSDSEIWMGSTYNLNGRVVIPEHGEIALHHWFDFRPIPEIEAEGQAKDTVR